MNDKKENKIIKNNEINNEIKKNTEKNFMFEIIINPENAELTKNIIKKYSIIKFYKNKNELLKQNQADKNINNKKNKEENSNKDNKYKKDNKIKFLFQINKNTDNKDKIKEILNELEDKGINFKIQELKDSKIIKSKKNNFDEIKKKLKGFDVIGDIALIYSELKDSEIKEIAKRILEEFKNIKTVCLRSDSRQGVYRLYKVKYIAGIKKFETIHKENNVKIKIDISKAYFSPRLSTERLRIAKLVRPNERILTMFSGVLPYPLVIQRNAKPKEQYAIELNPFAHEYAIENKILNKFYDIKVILGDAEQETKKLAEKNIKFNRIIMPLPKQSEFFIESALRVADKKCVIHLYIFEHKDKIKEKTKVIKEKIEKNKDFNFNVNNINIIKAGEYKPYYFRYCLDIYLNRKSN